MQNESVNKSAIKLMGLTVRTNNRNEIAASTAKIAGLATRYWQENMARHIPNRIAPGVTYSVYTEYASNEHGDYTYFIGEEVDSIEGASSEFQSLTIPASKYQKFTTPKGAIATVVITAWQAIWQMADLAQKRTYVADFEIYASAIDPQNASVEIYIGTTCPILI